MSESPQETLEKALGLHFISKMGLTCLWQLESHVEFPASNCDNAWQFFNIFRNPIITVSNRKRDLDSHLTSRSACIFLPRLVYIPELSLIPRQVPDFNEQTRVSNGHTRCNSRIYPRILPHCCSCFAFCVLPFKQLRSFWSISFLHPTLKRCREKSISSSF